MHVHVKYQCRMHEDLRFAARTCVLAWTSSCVYVWRVPMHSSLEIKTLCGTWLMIRRELKQHAEETTGKKRGARKRGGEERETRACARRGMSDCLCCTPAVAVWAALLSGCQADLSRWLASVSGLLKCDSGWGNLVEAWGREQWRWKESVWVALKTEPCVN